MTLVVFVMAYAPLLKAADPCDCTGRWLPYLEDSSPAVRRTVATLLGELREDACYVVPALETRLEVARDAAERQALLIALLGAVRGTSIAPRTVDLLMELLRDMQAAGSEDVQRQVEGILATVVLASDAATAELVRPLLRSDNQVLRLVALDSMAIGVPHDSEVLAGIRMVSRDTPSEGLMLAAELDAEDTFALASEVFSTSNEPEARRSALETIARLASTPFSGAAPRIPVARAADFLNRGLLDPAPIVIYAASDLLRSLGYPAPVNPDAERSRIDSRPLVAFDDRVESEWLDAGDSDARAIVRTAASDPCTRVRRAAASMLWNSSRSRIPDIASTLLLRQLSEDPDLATRNIAMRALADPEYTLSISTHCHFPDIESEHPAPQQ